MATVSNKMHGDMTGDQATGKIEKISKASFHAKGESDNLIQYEPFSKLKIKIKMMKSVM